MGLELSLGHVDAWTVVRASGEVDLTTADRLGATVREQARQGPVVVDLEGLTFMDSSGVRAVHGLLVDAQAGGWTLRFSPAMRENVRQVLWLTGVLEALPFREPSS